MTFTNIRLDGPARKFVLLALLALPGVAGAQTFTSTGKGDLLAGFRKTGGHAGANEMVAYLGNITNYIALPIGAVSNITAYGTAQITDAFPANLGNLQWSVFSTVKAIGIPEGNWVTPVGSFPKCSCWYTVPRTNSSIQSVPPIRNSYNSQGNLRAPILGVTSGANTISAALGSTNAFNNTNVLVEPVTYYNGYGNGYTLTSYIQDRNDSTFGNFGGNDLNFSVENTTPNTFSSPQISDLYQSCSTGGADPLSGQTSGSCYYLGYFTLNTDGTMSFTRAANAVTPPPPPPAPALSIAYSAGTATISFGTTNGATYNLIYNTLSGLTSARSTWPTLGSPIIGTGGVTNFTDSTATSGRFYSVTAH